jgi:hypothetical protein
MRPRARHLAIITAAVALAAMAFGAGSASATVKLCKVNMATCPAGSIYPSGSQFKAVGSAEFAGKTCELEMAFQTTAVSGAPIPAEITAFPFTHCPSGFSITPKKLHWTFQISGSSVPDGFGKIFQLGTVNPVELEVVGLGSSACLYELPSFTPTINGGGSIFTSMTADLIGSGCPATAAFTFKIVPVPTFYITG